jgi:hypothetical protein
LKNHRDLKPFGVCITELLQKTISKLPIVLEEPLEELHVQNAI